MTEQALFFGIVGAGLRDYPLGLVMKPYTMK